MTSYNHISSVIIRVLAVDTVDHGFYARSGQNNDFKIDMCCFTAKYAALRRKSKDWLARNRQVYPRTNVTVSQHYKQKQLNVLLIVQRTLSSSH